LEDYVRLVILTYLGDVCVPGEGEEDPLEDAGVEHLRLLVGVEVQLAVSAAEEEPHRPRFGALARLHLGPPVLPEAPEGRDSRPGANHDDRTRHVFRHVEPRRTKKFIEFYTGINHDYLNFRFGDKKSVYI